MNNIAIIDDHQLFREGIRQILIQDQSSDVQSFGSQSLSIQDVISIEPNLILLDDAISENPFKLIRLFHKKLPNTKIVMMTIVPEYERVLKALDLGVDGYILKDTDIETLYQCLSIVDNGENYIHHKISNILLEEYRKITSSNTYQAQERNELAYCPPYHLLSKRECEILQLLSEGLSNRAIGHELSISEMTVKNHVSNIMKKINVRDRTGAVLKAIKEGWVRFNYRESFEPAEIM
ncbi:MAG TPA: response regulator transcription factor [Massilibacterium sp.]|nr:response regulator transcription factor [Massilibacterium sp.]